MQNLEDLLRILACPVCHGELEACGNGEETTGFQCSRCALMYPIVDDIPVMLVDEAVPLDKWQQTGD